MALRAARHRTLGSAEGEELRDGFLLVVVRLEGRRAPVPVLHLGLAEGTLDHHMEAAAKASGIRGLRHSRLAEREAEGGCTGRLAEGDSSPGVEDR